MIESDIIEAAGKAADFEKNYRGKMTSDASPQFIKQALGEYESITLQSHKPAIYAQNVQAVDSNNPANGALLQKTMKAAIDTGSLLTFFTLELNNLPTEKLKSLSESAELESYKHFFEKLIETKPHRLSEKEEIILQQKSLTGGHAFVRLYDEIQASKQYELEIDGKSVTMNRSELLDLLKDDSRELRKKAANVFSADLAKDAKLNSYIMNTLLEDKAVNEKLTKFENPEQSRHLDNDITQSVVDTMVSVVSENFFIVEDYYNHKKNWLHLDELFDYDRYAPVTESSSKYDFDQAKDIVLGAFNRFSPEFGSAAQKFFDNKWIHVPPMHGKRGGAYCSGGTPDKHSLILLNYKGRMDDVSTLAHELGHGVNNVFMQHLSPINYDVTLVLAETASVFAEMLVFDDMREKASDQKEKFALHALKVESIFATVFRQVSMHKFEQVLHNARRTRGELSPDDIHQIWLDTQLQMFGKSVTFQEGYKYWWSYIQHFYHVPFYVYAYAFGELLVLSLYARYKQDGSAFVPKYLDLMRAGTTASPQELLKPMGIDLNDRAFWQNGINIIKEMVDETIKLKPV